MASLASELIEEVTAHAQSDSLEDELEICADNIYFPNNLLIIIAAGHIVGAIISATYNQYRIKQEIKFLYTKNFKLNEQLFKLHLKCADKWQRIWPITVQSIDYKLTKEMETHYNNLNRKLDKLQREKQTREKQTPTTNAHNSTPGRST